MSFNIKKNPGNSILPNFHYFPSSIVQLWTFVDFYGHLLTSGDNCGQFWTAVNSCVQLWTVVDSCVQLWIFLNLPSEAGQVSSIELFLCFLTLYISLTKITSSKYNCTVQTSEDCIEVSSIELFLCYLTLFHHSDKNNQFK